MTGTREVQRWQVTKVLDKQVTSLARIDVAKWVLRECYEEIDEALERGGYEPLRGFYSVRWTAMGWDPMTREVMETPTDSDPELWQVDVTRDAAPST